MTVAQTFEVYGHGHRNGCRRRKGRVEQERISHATLRCEDDLQRTHTSSTYLPKMDKCRSV
jgi:hypothetical protein